MIGFIDAIKMFFTRYVDFEGRSTRAEHWWVFLFMVIVYTVLATLAVVTMDLDTEEVTPLSMVFWGAFFIFWLACFIPTIALVVRRFHDQDRSGWMYLLRFIPYIGIIIVWVFMCMDGTKGPNRFGEDPFNDYLDIFE